MKTNEVKPLSKNLGTITAEIKTYEAVTSQSIFEIGKRLIWVKENDLAHGQFMSWLKSINLEVKQADRFMKVARELPNWTTWSNLGLRVLYEVATLPKPQQQEVEEQVKQGNNPTVKEITELKHQLKQHEQTIADQQAELEDNRKAQIELNQRLSEANNRQPEPKVVTKTVTKEVKPDDYDTIKAKLAELEKQSAKGQEDVNYYKRELQAAERIHKNEHATDHSKELRLKRLKRDAEINAYSVSLNIDQWNGELRKVTHEDIDYMGKQAQKNLRKRLDTLQELINKINAMFDGPEIIEGEINHG